MLVLTDLIGLTKDEAQGCIVAEGSTPRITCEDENDYIGTCEWRLDRVNLKVKNGKVVEANRG